MTPPFGLPHPPRYVHKLHRALYGLKHAHREWFGHFSNPILRIGYTQSLHDSALFHCSYARSRVLIMYVVDMIIMRDDPAGIDALKDFLCSQFDMKDLSPLHYFLALKLHILRMVISSLKLSIY